MVVQELSLPWHPFLLREMSNFALTWQLQLKISKHYMNANDLTLLPEMGKFIHQEMAMRYIYVYIKTIQGAGYRAVE